MDAKPGSQRIGSLIAKIAATPRHEDGRGTALTSRPPPSGIDARGTSHGMPTGMRHGEHGSGMRTNSMPATRGHSTALVLDSRDPAASLRRRVTSCLASTWIDGDTGYGWDGRVAGYELVAPLQADELAEAIGTIEAALMPAPAKQIVAELTRLRQLTISRDRSTVDLELLLAAYADELRQYPGDAVTVVLREWPRSHRFWPSLAELVELLEPIVTPRRELLNALRRGYREPEVSPDWVRPTAAEIADAEALLRQHGIEIDHRGRLHPREVEPMTRADHERMQRELAEFRSRFAAANAG